jgi:hypothetical protein
MMEETGLKGWVGMTRKVGQTGHPSKVPMFTVCLLQFKSHAWFYFSYLIPVSLGWSTLLLWMPSFYTEGYAVLVRQSYLSIAVNAYPSLTWGSQDVFKSSMVIPETMHLPSMLCCFHENPWRSRLGKASVLRTLMLLVWEWGWEI